MNYEQKIKELESRLNMAAHVVSSQQKKIQELNRRIEALHTEKHRIIFDLDRYSITDAESDIGAIIQRMEKIEKELKSAKQKT